VADTLLGDTAYDSSPFRQWLQARGTKPVFPNKANRKQPFRFDKKAYRQRHRIENAFCRLKDFRRIAVTTGWPETTSPRSASSPLSYGGFYESRP
jgi:transposase